MLKIFFRNLRHYKVAYGLNILGLVVAFLLSVILIAQVKYDFSFDKFHKDSQNIYRLERLNHEWMSWVNSLSAQEFMTSSPSIESAAMLYPASKPTYVVTENKQGKVGFIEDIISCTPGITEVFDFNMIEGTSSLLEPVNVIIPETMGKRMYGEESAIGRTLFVESYIFGVVGNLFTITGVYKDFPNNSQIRNAIYIKISDLRVQVRSMNNFNVYARLNDSDNAEAVGSNFYEKFVKDRAESDAMNFRLVPMSDIYFQTDCSLDPYAKKGNIATTLTLLGIAILILVIVAINFINFSMALIPFKMKSTNLNKILGGTNSHLRKMLIGESIIITLMSFILAISILIPLSNTGIKDIVVADISFGEIYPIIILIGLISIIIGLIAGLYPAKYTTSFPPVMALKGSFGLSSKGRNLRKVLLALQFVISITMVAIALLVNKQNKFMQTTELGLDKEDVLIISISADSKERVEMIGNRIKSLAEVEDIAYASDKICVGDRYQNWGVGLNDEKTIQTTMIPVSWNFLDVMKIPIIMGRDFQKSDEQMKEMQMLICNRELSDNDGITPQKYSNVEIVGICENIHVFSMRKSLGNMSFMVGRINRSCYGYVKLKKGVDYVQAIENIRNAYKEIDPYYPFEIDSFESILDIQYASEKKFADIIGAFSTLAVIISMMGIFGLIFLDTRQRRRELALRRVYGASETELLWDFNRGYVILFSVCFLLSIPLILYFSNIWLSNFAYRVDMGAMIFVITFVIVLLITILTINVQALKAVRRNPTESIKSE